MCSLMLSGLVVRVLWVPSMFQLADPPSRLQGGFTGDKMKAERMAWLIYKQLLRDTSVVEFRSVLCLGRGTAYSQGWRWLPRWAMAFIFVCLLVGALAPCRSLRALHTFPSFGSLFVS